METGTARVKRGAKARIGHYVEAKVLESLEVDYLDESVVLTPSDEVFHIDKHEFTVPFVSGAKDLGEALRQIGEGASMIRTHSKLAPSERMKDRGW